MHTLHHRYRVLFTALLVTVLLLVQSALLLHEIEHAVSGDNDHCVSCWVADHQHSYAADNVQFMLSQFSDFFIKSTATILLFAHIFNYYTSRAPPASNFI